MSMSPVEGEGHCFADTSLSAWVACPPAHLLFKRSGCSMIVGSRWGSGQLLRFEVARTIREDLRRGRDPNPAHGAGNNLNRHATCEPTP